VKQRDDTSALPAQARPLGLRHYSLGDCVLYNPLFPQSNKGNCSTNLDHGTARRNADCSAQPLHPDHQSGAETAQCPKPPTNGRLTPRQELEYLCDASVITPQQLSSLLSQIPAQTALHAPLSVGAVPGAVPVNDAVPAAPMANLNINRDDEKKHGNSFYQPSPAPTPAQAPPAYAAPPPSMPPLAQATALYAYNGTDPGDLELHPNDHINVTEYMNAEWWKGKSSRTGQEGIFPRSYVRVIENTLPQAAPTNYGNMPLEVSGQGDGSGKVPSKGEEMGKKFGKKVLLFPVCLVLNTDSARSLETPPSSVLVPRLVVTLSTPSSSLFDHSMRLVKSFVSFPCLALEVRIFGVSCRCSNRIYSAAAQSSTYRNGIVPLHLDHCLTFRRAVK